MMSQWIHRILTQRPYRKWKIPSGNPKPRDQESFCKEDQRVVFGCLERKDGKSTGGNFAVYLSKKDSKKIEQIFGDYLWNTISIRDTAVAKENFIKYGIACYKNIKVVIRGIKVYV